MGEVPDGGRRDIEGFASGCEEGCELQQLYFSGSSSSVSDVHGSMTIAGIAADGDDPGDWRLTRTPPGARPALRHTRARRRSKLTPSASGLALDIAKGDSTVVRLTTADLPGSPPMVATTTTALEEAGGDDVEGASLIGTRTPMRVPAAPARCRSSATTAACPTSAAALREYGDLSTDVSITQLLVAPGTPPRCMQDVRKAGVDLAACAPRPTCSTSSAPTPSRWAGRCSCWSAC